MDKFSYGSNNLVGCFVIFIVSIFLFIFMSLLWSLPVMWLWNWLMPSIFGVCKLTWVEALGLTFLARILFCSTVSTQSK